MNDKIIEKYIWIAVGENCPACDALDRQEFKKIDEIPDKPHPNCDCFLQEVEGELCDYCIDCLDKMEEMIGDAESLQAEIEAEMNNLASEMMTQAGELYRDIAQAVLDEAATWDNALGDFARNYNDMIEANTKNADKYFHAKANCEASQRGFTGEVTAQALSAFRELEEGTRKVIFEGVDLVKQIEDARKDMEANRYGRKQGCQNPDGDCGGLVDKYRPRGLDEKY